MVHTPRSTLLRVLALAAMACVAAWVSNALATPARRLVWSASIAPLPALPRQVEPPQTPPPPIPPQPLQPAPERQPIAPAPPSAGLRATGPQPPVLPKPAEPQPSNPIREITREEAWKAYQEGVPFLDARRSAEFAEGHVAKAWSAPVWEADLDDRLLSFKAARRPGPEDPIVIYCSGGDCRDSHLLAAKLLNEGYFHLLIFRDGFPAWVTQGHPVEKGQP